MQSNLTDNFNQIQWSNQTTKTVTNLMSQLFKSERIATNDPDLTQANAFDDILNRNLSTPDRQQDYQDERSTTSYEEPAAQSSTWDSPSHQRDHDRPWEQNDRQPADTASPPLMLPQKKQPQ